MIHLSSSPNWAFRPCPSARPAQVPAWVSSDPHQLGHSPEAHGSSRASHSRPKSAPNFLGKKDNMSELVMD